MNAIVKLSLLILCFTITGYFYWQNISSDYWSSIPIENPNEVIQVYYGQILPEGVYGFGIVLVILLGLLIWSKYNCHKETTQLKSDIKVLSQKLDLENLRFQAFENMMKYEEADRQITAKKLHDGLGGLIASARIHVQEIHDRIEVDLFQDLFQLAEDILDNASDEVRNVSYTIMPESLFYFGIKDAIEDLAIRLTNDQIKVSTHFRGLDDLTIEKHRSWMLFQMIQDLTNKVMSHPDVSEIMIQFAYQDGDALLTVEDNGKESILLTLENDSEILNLFHSGANFLGGYVDNYSNKGEGNSISVHFRP